MKAKYSEDVVHDVRKDYEMRSSERRQFEAQWQLNSNFVLGNQFSTIGVNGDVTETERDYYWQEREVYNHIASIVETRLARLSKVRPKMSVRPASTDESDIRAGKTASKILNSIYHKLDVDNIIAKATMWSELTGSVFYKVVWDKSLGKTVGLDKHGKPLHEGEVRIDVCPPYEIFPNTLAAQDVEDCTSIIHARAVQVDEIRRLWGVDVKPESVDALDLSDVSVVGGLGMSCSVPKVNRVRPDEHAVVIERYTRPSEQFPNGKLEIVAGDKLLYYGELPYINGIDETRDLPFIKQDSLIHAGCFYGISMVERAIPIQRAYNAVKNRKHEFMNRIAMGVLAVEDGSVDISNLETEGLSPGKVLVYRQGSNPPVMMNAGSIPNEFSHEEDRLLSEFISISGVSEISRSSSVPSSITSGTALQLLLEQDDTRLSATAERIRAAVRKMAQFMIRLYKQFVVGARLSRCIGSNGEVETISWRSSNMDCDDVVFDTDNELSNTIASRQAMIFDLLKAGLLHDENGKLSDSMRYKILDVLGYGGWECTRDDQRLHVNRADKENLKLPEGIEVSEIDDHRLHIEEHTRYMLSPEFEKVEARHPHVRQDMLEHIRMHKQCLSLASSGEFKEE